jgi:16S rRNA (uracil1498-N3)-methyltransferase
MHAAGISASVGEEMVIEGDEAHHAARVKRVSVGELVEVLNGRGLIVEGRVEAIRKKARGDGWEVAIRVVHERHLEPDSPRIEVWSAVPKGDRFEEMIDQLTQVGVAQWSPLHSARSVVDPRLGKMQRVARRAAEASKQCGRAWELELGIGGGITEALAATDSRIVVADASGVPFCQTGAARIRVLVGPEGGWDTSELEQVQAAGAIVAQFGRHVMRLETAAVVAAAVVGATEGYARGEVPL